MGIGNPKESTKKMLQSENIARLLDIRSASKNSLFS